MKLLKVQKPIKIITDLRFAILILGIIALTSSVGSFIEQDEGKSFYEENYLKPIYGFIDSNLILITVNACSVPRHKTSNFETRRMRQRPPL